MPQSAALHLYISGNCPLRNDELLELLIKATECVQKFILMPEIGSDR